MRRKTAFQPTLADPLEDRMLLSHAGAGNSLHAASAHPAKVSAPSSVALINSSFDSFVQDYSQARAIYLSAINPPSGAMDLKLDPNYLAFLNYTRYRVDLLGQQVERVLVDTYSIATKSGHSGKTLWNDFAPLVPSRINGLAKSGGTATQPFNDGTLGQALDNSTPPANSAAATGALDSLAQDQAINSARIGVTNGFTYNINTFNKSKHK